MDEALHQDGAGEGGEERRGHGDGADAEESEEADFDLFAAQGEQPENGGERTGDGEVGAEIDADEGGVGDEAAGVGGLEGGSCDEAEGEVVDEVVADRDGEGGDEGGGGGGEALGGGEPGLRQVKGTDGFDGIDEDEEAGNEDEGGPADLAGEDEGVALRFEGDGGGDGERREAGGEAEILLEGGGCEEGGYDEEKTREDQLAFRLERFGLHFGVDRGL